VVGFFFAEGQRALLKVLNAKRAARQKRLHLNPVEDRVDGDYHENNNTVQPKGNSFELPRARRRLLF
jgi:hypothetical protein